MKIIINKNVCKVYREEGDKKMPNESRLLYQMKKILNANGFEFIKKLVYKDGHLYGDDNLHYLRAKKQNNDNSNNGIYCIVDGNWQIRAPEKDYNEGCVVYDVHYFPENTKGKIVNLELTSQK